MLSIPAPIASRFHWAAERYIPPFENGERMDQKAFLTLYEQTPKGFRAELIGGTVHMPSPVSVRHGRPHQKLAMFLGTYADESEGTEAFIDITAIMAEDSVPQPDLTLIVTPEAGGQTAVNARGYLTGAPELAVEVSNTTAGIDLNAKLVDYQRYGVREYLVVIVREQEVRWFSRRKDRFTPMKPNADGLLKSKTFPGLWLNPEAVFDRSTRRLLATLRDGLKSADHAKFVAKLAKKLTASETA